MWKVFVVLLGCCLFISCFKLTGLNDENKEELKYFTSFIKYIQTYNRKYNAETFEEKYNIFKENYDTIERLNAQSPNKVFGINKFTDMPQDEFSKFYLLPKGKVQGNKRGTPSSDDLLKPKENIVAPDTFDWRNQGAVTRVKNQAQCGSCWAFSVTENVESVWIIAKKATNTTLKLSPQQIVDCDTDDEGCDGGDTPTAFKYIIKAGGLESDKDYPYTANDGDCAFHKTKVVAKISAWKYATQNSNEDTMKNNLVSWAPLSICVDAARWQFYSGGVMTSKDCGKDLDHCVQLIGYDKNSKGVNYWIVRNSWGTDWGLEGYIYLQMGGDTCGCADEATTAVAST